MADIKPEDDSDDVLTIDPVKLLHSWSQLPKSKSATEAIQLLLSCISLKKTKQETPATRKRKAEEKGETQNKRAKAEWKCLSCNIAFKNKWVMSRHMNNKRLHPVQSKKLRGVASNATRFRCELCKKTLSNRHNLNRHILTVHKSAKNKPKIVSVENKTVKNVEKVGIIAEIVFVCEECTTATKEIDSAIEHSQLHTLEGYKPILQSCDDCKLAFESQYFADHLPNHNYEFVKVNYSPNKLLNADWPEMFSVLSRTRVNRIKSSSIYEYTRKVKMNCDNNAGKPLYQCDLCELYVSPKEVEDHCKEGNVCVKNQTIKHYCPDCEIYFYTSGALKEHEKDHRGHGSYSFKIVSFNCERDAPINKVLLKLNNLQVGEQSEDDEVLPPSKAVEKECVVREEKSGYHEVVSPNKDAEIQCASKYKRIEMLDNRVVREEKSAYDEVLSPNKAIDTQCGTKNKIIEILDNCKVSEEKSGYDEVVSQNKAVQIQGATKYKRIEILDNRLVREEKSPIDDEVLAPKKAIETQCSTKNKGIEILDNRVVVSVSQLCCGKFILLSDLEAHKATHTDKGKIEVSQTVEEAPQGSAGTANGEEQKIPHDETSQCVLGVVKSASEITIDNGNNSSHIFPVQATSQEPEIQNNVFNGSNAEKPNTTPSKAQSKIANMLDNFSEEMKNELRHELQKLIKHNDLHINDAVVDSTVPDPPRNANNEINKENMNADNLIVARYNPNIIKENDIKIEPETQDTLNEHNNITSDLFSDTNDIIEIDDSDDEIEDITPVVEIKKEPDTESNPRPSSRYILSKMLPSTSTELDLTDVIGRVKRNEEKRKSEQLLIIEESRRIKQILFSRD